MGMSANAGPRAGKTPRAFSRNSHATPAAAAAPPPMMVHAREPACACNKPRAGNKPQMNDSADGGRPRRRPAGGAPAAAAVTGLKGGRHS